LLSANLLCMLPPHRAAAQQPVPQPAPCTQVLLKNSVTVNGLVFRNYQGQSIDDAGCVKVFRNGEVIFQLADPDVLQYSLGQPANRQYGIPPVLNGTDVTGRGHPDMIVTAWTGGAHCCSRHYIFELEPKFRLLARLEDADDDLAHFADLKHDRHYYYLAADWTFAYWQASFADSPSVAVILKFVPDNDSGSFHLALDRMEKPAPTPNQWKTAVAMGRGAFGENNPVSGGIGSELWGQMLDWIYSGHSDYAWKLFDRAWPADKPGKDAFLGDFCSVLKTSPYWPDLESTVKEMPLTCAQAKPRRDD
jgi:hypothetical protein